MWLAEHTVGASNRKCWKLATRTSYPTRTPAPLSYVQFFAFNTSATPSSLPLVFGPFFISPSAPSPRSAVDVSWRAEPTADEHDFLWSESLLVELLVLRKRAYADPRSELSAGAGRRGCGA